MILTTKSRYAVMAIIDVCTHDEGEPVRLSDISERQNIPLAYLEQIFSLLKQSGIVHSVRGPGGGYFLSKNPKNVTVLDIVDAVDESLDMTRCHDWMENGGEKCVVGCMSSGKRCNSHELWRGLTLQMRGYLASITIESAVAMHINKERCDV